VSKALFIKTFLLRVDRSPLLWDILVVAKCENLNYLTGFRLWRQYWRHFWGYIFFGGIFPSKMGRFAPFLATIQRLSKTCAFLSKKRSEGCFVWAAPSLLLAPTYFIIALNMWFVSWESTPARVKASKRGAK
jgi:hypothetical protein